MASNSASFRINGIDELSKRIQAAPENLQKRALRPAIRAALQVIRNDAVRRAERIDDPRTPTSIADNIGMKTFWRKNERAMHGSVGVEGGARYRRGDKDAGKTTYWRFVELGTERSRARPFLRPALANNTEQAMQELIHELERQMTLKGA